MFGRCDTFRTRTRDRACHSARFVETRMTQQCIAIFMTMLGLIISMGAQFLRH